MRKGHCLAESHNITNKALDVLLVRFSVYFAEMKKLKKDLEKGWDSTTSHQRIRHNKNVKSD